MAENIKDENPELLKELISSVQKKNDGEVDNSIKSKPAKVIGVDDETYKVYVYFLDDTEQKEYTFLNKTGEIISEGDNVKVFYTSNPAKGWIGERCGEPVLKEPDPIIPYVTATVQNQSAVAYDRIERGVLSVDFSVDDNKSDVVFVGNQMCNVNTNGNLTALYKVDGATQEFKLVENMDNGKRVMTHVYPMSLNVGKHNFSVYLLSENGGKGNIPVGSFMGTLSGQISGIEIDAPANDNLVFYYTGVPAGTNIVLPPYIINDYSAKKYIDWGDGSDIEESEACYGVSHTYVDAGDYIITIKSDSMVFGGHVNPYSKIADTDSGSSNYLTKVYFPDNVTSLSFSATEQTCPNLETLYFGKNTKSISWYFGENKITSLLIPNGVTSVYASMMNRTKISSFRIPESVINWSNDVYLPASCKLVEVYGNPGNANIRSSGLVTLRVGGNATSVISAFNCTTLKNIEAVNATKAINVGSFANDTGLTTVKLPNTIKSIVNVAFENCENLTSINIPSGVTAIGTRTFNHCYSLEEIDLPEVQTIEDMAFEYCKMLSKISFPKVQTIGYSAFESCTSLTEIELPETLYYIGNRAFCSIKNLTKITIPKSVKTIGQEAFYGTGLTEVKIAKDCVVYNYAFPTNCVIEYYD